MEAQDNIRKRVCKACDRCRLKKSKCDGVSPCSRCKTDNAICVFGERKKSQDKVYPKGYVEMLEQQQTQLVAGLRELYARLHTGLSWPGQPLREAQGGHPLTHDILERLNLLHQSNEDGSNYGDFEEDCNRMRQKMLKREASFSRRHGSVSSDSEHGHTSSPSSYSGTPTIRQFPFTNLFARNNALSTQPINRPSSKQSQMTAPTKQESSMASSTFMPTDALDPAALSRAWMNDPMMLEELMDFHKPMEQFKDFNTYDQIMMVDPIFMDPKDLMMPEWNNTNDLDFNNITQNPFSA